MVRFFASIDGIPAFDRAFNRVENFIADMRQFAPGISREFYAIETTQFKSEGAHGASGKWAALSLVYAKFKAKAFPGQPTLKATNSLYESMTSPDALDSIFRVDERGIVLGTQREGATAHQRGSKRMPARPIISFVNDDRRRIQKAIQAELVRFTRNLGFSVQET